MSNKTLNQKLKHYITHPYENFYKTISIGWLIQTSVYIFLTEEILSTLSHTNFNTSPLFWHSAGDHHLWDLIALLLFYQVQVRYFKQTPFLSLLNLLFLTYINEVYWYYTFVISHIVYNEYFNPAWVLSLQQLSFAIFILFMLYVYRKLDRFPTFYLLTITPIYIIWIYFGFHVTVDYQGYTQFYYDIPTNLTEIGHWFNAIILWAINQ